jgi:hypothetical protein
MVATFDPNIFFRGAQMRQQSNQDLLGTLQGLAGAYAQSQQKQKAQQEAERKQAAAQALDPTNILAQAMQDPSSLTPQQRAIFDATQLERGAKRGVDQFGRPYQAYEPIALPDGGVSPATQALFPQAVQAQSQQASPAASVLFPAPQSGAPALVVDQSIAQSPAAQMEREKANIEIEKEAAKASMGKEAAKPLAERSFVAMQTQVDNIEKQIDLASKQVGGMTAGLASATSFIGGTPAADLRARLETIQADAAFGRLQEMRDNSKTGGALGQVSERELALLQNATSALNQSQSPEQLKDNLDAYKQVRRDALARVAEAYKQDYGQYPAGYKPKGSDKAQSGGDFSGFKIRSVR